MAGEKVQSIWAMYAKHTVKVALILVFGIAAPLLSFYLVSFFGGEQTFAYRLQGNQLLFSPLAIWASVAFFAVQLPNRSNVRTWEVYGTWLGLFLSVLCLVLGFFTLGKSMFVAFSLMSGMGVEPIVSRLFLLALSFAPWYTPVWYYLVLDMLRHEHSETYTRVRPHYPFLVFLGFSIFVVIVTLVFKNPLFV